MSATPSFAAVNSAEYKPLPPMTTHYFDCKCSSSEHTLRFVYDPLENEIYTEVFLDQNRGFFKRIWVAIKYIFGYKCQYGHFDCWLMKEEDCAGLIELLKKVAIPASKLLEDGED